jgi:hypothetical protein
MTISTQNICVAFQLLQKVLYYQFSYCQEHFIHGNKFDIKCNFFLSSPLKLLFDNTVPFWSHQFRKKALSDSSSYKYLSIECNYFFYSP